MKFTVWVAQVALDHMVAEARREPHLEVGGVLMGHWVDAGAVVTAVVGPGPAAKKRRRRFGPDSNWQSREIARIYRESGRTTTYLGDWHSHPGLPPMPSLLDVSTAKRISLAEESRAPNPLMVILGEDAVLKTPVLAAYRYDGKRLRPCALAPC